MTKQDLVTVGILKIPQKHAFARISFFRFQVFVRQAVTVNAADAKRLAFYSNIPVLVLQNDCTGVLIQLCDISVPNVPGILSHDFPGTDRREQSGIEKKLNW